MLHCIPLTYLFLSDQKVTNLTKDTNITNGTSVTTDSTISTDSNISSNPNITSNSNKTSKLNTSTQLDIPNSSMSFNKNLEKILTLEQIKTETEIKLEHDDTDSQIDNIEPEIDNIVPEIDKIKSEIDYIDDALVACPSGNILKYEHNIKPEFIEDVSNEHTATASNATPIENSKSKTEKNINFVKVLLKPCTLTKHPARLVEEDPLALDDRRKDLNESTGEYSSYEINVTPSQDRFIRCTECILRFYSRTTYNVHLLSHYFKKMGKCQVCGEFYANKKHTVSNHHLSVCAAKLGSVFKCCSVEQKRQSYLTHFVAVHLNSFNNAGEHVCPECSECFHTTDDYDNHLLLHYYEYECGSCPVCKMPLLKTHPNFTSHTLICVNKRGSFNCDLCGFRMANFKRHFIQRHLESFLQRLQKKNRKRVESDQCFVKKRRYVAHKLDDDDEDDEEINAKRLDVGKSVSKQCQTEPASKSLFFLVQNI